MAELAVLYDRVRPDEKMLFEALDNLGVPYDKVFTPQLSITFPDGKEAGDALPWKVALERCVSQSRGHAVTRALEGLGVRVINPSHVIELCGDKLATNAAMGRAGLPTPKTGVAFTPESALALIERIGYPVVMKPTVGSWGRMVSKLNDRDAAEAVIEHKDVLGGPQHQIFYVQELIREARARHPRLRGGRRVHRGDLPHFRALDHQHGARREGQPVRTDPRDHRTGAAGGQRRAG